jgi:hypothetical protein
MYGDMHRDLFDSFLGFYIGRHIGGGAAKTLAVISASE